MKLRIEMNPLVLLLLALLILLLLPDRAGTAKQEWVIREESELEKRRRKYNAQTGGRFYGRGNGTEKVRKTAEQEIAEKDAELFSVIEGHVTSRKASGH